MKSITINLINSYSKQGFLYGLLGTLAISVIMLLGMVRVGFIKPKTNRKV